MLTSGGLAGSGETPEFPVLHDGPAHPVDLGVTCDGLVVDVDHDDLVVLVGRVLANPVGVEDAKPLEPSAHPLLSDGLQVPLRLLLVHRSRGLGLTIGAPLGHWPLPPAAPHRDPVDAEALLGLVPKPARLVRS